MIASVTIVDLLLGVPALLLYFGGWPFLTFYSLRRWTRLPKIVNFGVALLVGIGFLLFIVRFTASVPGTTGFEWTSEQKIIARIHWFLVVAPYFVLLTLLSVRYFRRRQSHD